MANELTCLVNVDPVAVLTKPGAVLPLLIEIEKECRSHILSADTEDGRDQIRSLANRIARSKTFVDDAGKDHVAVIKKQAGLIDAERKIYRDRMDSLKEEIRAPLTAWEQAEENRVKGHEDAIANIEAMRMMIEGLNAVEIDAKIDAMRQIFEGRNWEEFHDRAFAANKISFDILYAALGRRQQWEKDQYELEALRKANAARDQADREQKIRDEAAAKAREEEAAKLKASEEARIAAEKKAADDKVKAEADAKRREEAAAQKVRDEQAAKEAKEKADTEAREKNRSHKAKINNGAKAAIANEIRAAVAANPDPEEVATAIVKAIAAGAVPHISISY